MKRPLLLIVAAVFVVVLAGGAGPCDVFLGNAECAKDSDCHAERLCTDDGRCVECLRDRDCGEGELCDTDNTCVRGGEGEGVSGGEGEGEGSNGGEGEGASHSCSSACNCDVGQACVNHECTAPSGTCSSNTDCPRASSSSSSCVVETCDGFFCNAPSGEGEGSAGEGEGEGACDTSTLEITCFTQGLAPDDATCSCVPLPPSGEGEGEGASDTCANHINQNPATNGQDGCDCGCGTHDPDCGTGGCDTPGCATNTVVSGCSFCWDGNTQTTSCAGQGQ